MVDVISEIIISRPLEAVYSYASNPDNTTHWYVNIKSVSWVNEPPIRLGSKMQFMARFLGKELVYTYECTELEPLKKLVMRTAEGPFPMETTYTWERITNGSTKMVLRNRGTPSGFSKLFAPMMATMMKRANEKDLALLKKILEQ